MTKGVMWISVNYCCNDACYQAKLLFTFVKVLWGNDVETICCDIMKSWINLTIHGCFCLWEAWWRSEVHIYLRSLMGSVIRWENWLEVLRLCLQMFRFSKSRHRLFILSKVKVKKHRKDLRDCFWVRGVDYEKGRC